MEGRAGEVGLSMACGALRIVCESRKPDPELHTVGPRFCSDSIITVPGSSFWGRNYVTYFDFTEIHSHETWIFWRSFAFFLKKSLEFQRNYGYIMRLNLKCFNF